MSGNYKVIVGVLAVLAFLGVIFGIYAFGQRQIQPAPQPTPTPAAICDSCPQFIPPHPDFCKDGIIVPGERDECGCQMPPTCQRSCVKADTGEEMSFVEAEEIALESECVEEGSLTGQSFCNQDTGTWWLDLEIEKEGCAPACVINVSTKKAEINWRCTGLRP